MLALEDLGPAGIDLSQATRLKKVKVWLGSLDDAPTAMALNTLTSGPRDLQNISLFICVCSRPWEIADIRQIVRGGIWIDLDRFLVQLWESNVAQIRVQAVCLGGARKEVVRKLVRSPLPGATRRGAV